MFRALTPLTLGLLLAACASNGRRPTPDGGAVDTGTSDTSVGDTGASDTGVGDTSSPDGGDTGVMCSSGLMVCGAACVDTLLDPSHCGGCDLACASGEDCEAGACVVPCDAATPTRCGDACVDTTTDTAHCGMCDMACASGELCTDGICCAMGLTACGGACTDTASDVTNCGACGTTCMTGESCAMGTCRTGFTGATGTAWQSVGTILRGLQEWVPAGETYMYAGSGSTFVRHEIATMTTTSRVAPPVSLAGWGSPSLVSGDLWEIVVPSIVRHDVAANTWTTVRSDLTSGSTAAMTVSDEAGNIWSYRTGDVLIRYHIATDTVTEFPTGVTATTQTRLGYDPGTNSIYFGNGLGPASFHRFDIATETVSTLATHPEGALSDTFCSDRSGHIYAAGNCGGPTMFQYDIATDTWSSIPDIPTSGCNGSCSVHEDGWLYVEDSATAHRIELF